MLDILASNTRQDTTLAVFVVVPVVAIRWLYSSRTRRYNPATAISSGHIAVTFVDSAYIVFVACDAAGEIAVTVTSETWQAIVGAASNCTLLSISVSSEIRGDSLLPTASISPVHGDTTAEIYSFLSHERLVNHWSVGQKKRLREGV